MHINAPIALVIFFVLIILLAIIYRGYQKEHFSAVFLKITNSPFYNKNLFDLLNQPGDERFRTQIMQTFRELNLSSIVNPPSSLVEQIMNNIAKDLFVVIDSANIVCDQITNPMIRRTYKVIFESREQCVLQIVVDGQNKNHRNIVTRANLVNILNALSPTLTAPACSPAPTPRSVAPAPAPASAPVMVRPPQPQQLFNRPYPPTDGSLDRAVNSTSSNLIMSCNNASYGNGTYEFQLLSGSSSTLFNVFDRRRNRPTTITSHSSNAISLIFTLPIAIIPRSFNISRTGNVRDVQFYGSSDKRNFVTLNLSSGTTPYRFYKIDIITSGSGKFSRRNIEISHFSIMGLA